MMAKRVLTLKPTSYKSTYGMYNARSNFALGISATNLTLVGGISGTSGNNGGVQYPVNYVRQTQGGATGAAASLGATYTWPGKAQIGNDLYFADGHDGAYKTTFRKMNVDTGGPTTLASTPGTARITSAMVGIANNTKIFRAGGSSAAGTLKETSIYDIASNTWVTKAPMLFGSNGHFAVNYNNKVYVPFGWSDDRGANSKKIQVYDIATDSWSELPTVLDPKFFPNGTSWGNGCIINGVIWCFTSNVFQNGVNTGKLGLVKYYIDADRYEYFITTYGLRFAFEVAVHPVTKDIYVVGGVPQSPGSANYDAAARINEVLVFAST